MVNERCIGRFSILAAGMGIGAAIASIPGTASADPASDTDAASAVVGSALAADLFPAADPASNIAISIDGFTLLQEGTATATSDFGDFAIAVGDHSTASATGGLFNIASAFGDNSGADTLNGNLLAAFADGTGSHSDAISGNVDLAVATGTNAGAGAGPGDFNAVFANGTDSTATAQGEADLAFANGTDSNASAGGGPGFDFDTASAWGDHTTAEAYGGSFDNAATIDPGGSGGLTFARIGDHNDAFVFGDSDATAGGVSPGPPNADILGNNDIAIIIGNGDGANAGSFDTPGDFDLAAVFGNDLGIANALDANYVVDILPASI